MGGRHFENQRYPVVAAVRPAVCIRGVYAVLSQNLSVVARTIWKWRPFKVKV
jgi:hypothetical protein